MYIVSASFLRLQILCFLSVNATPFLGRIWSGLFCKGNIFRMQFGESAYTRLGMSLRLSSSLPPSTQYLDNLWFLHCFETLFHNTCTCFVFSSVDSGPDVCSHISSGLLTPRWMWCLLIKWLASCKAFQWCSEFHFLFFLSRADTEKYLFTLFVSKNTFLCFINLKEKQNCVSGLNWCGNVCKQ